MNQYFIQTLDDQHREILTDQQNYKPTQTWEK